MTKSKTITVKGAVITIIKENDNDFISITDMLKARDGEFFISDWLRNRKSVEFLGIWESVYNPAFNYGEFAIIKSQADYRYNPGFKGVEFAPFKKESSRNSFYLSAKKLVEKTNTRKALQ